MTGFMGVLPSIVFIYCLPYFSCLFDLSKAHERSLLIGSE